MTPEPLGAMGHALLNPHVAEDAVRIQALTRDGGLLAELSLGDLFDLEELQKIQDAFAEATDVASIITDTQGRPLTRPSGFCRLCEQVIRGTECGLAHCMLSDATLGANCSQVPSVQRCLSGGLLDGGAAIYAGDRHIANWLVGQVLDTQADPLELLGYAREIGVDEAVFRAALNEVPRMPEAKFGKVVRALHLIAGQLSRLAFQNLQQVNHLLERKRTEAALRERERSLMEAQEAGQVGTYVWDMPGDRWDASAVLDRLFGIGPDHPRTAQGWIDLVEPEYRPKAELHLRGVVAGLHPFDLEYPILRGNDQQLRWLHGKGRVEWAADGSPLRLIGTILDITDRRAADLQRRELEGEIQHAMRIESIGFLAGGIAHDMNNVLGAIQAVCETQLLKHADDPGLSRALGLIEKASGRGRDLVQGLTNFARKDQREPEPLDLNVLVREEMDLLGRTSLQKIQLVMVLEEPLPRILGEKGALSSTLMNLCVNAMDAMPQGGTLTLRTHSLPDAQVALSVDDTGHGMPPEVLARSKEPFFTTKEVGKGTGLGLAMAAATVKAHGGSLSLRSEVGQGTSVRIYLPSCTPPREQLASAVLAGPSGLPRRILLVDDDELIRDSVPAMLEACGHTVVTAAGGREGLACLANGLEVDLLILDLNMPGLNGAETLAALRPSHPQLPVLLATGFLDPATALLLQQDGRSRCITKPFRLVQLNQLVRELTGA